MTKNKRPYTRRRSTSSFPYKLYKLLLDEEAKSSNFDEGVGRRRLVSFQGDGLSFLIWDPDRFMDEVATRYFKMSKYRSFVSVDLSGFTPWDPSSSLLNPPFYCLIRRRGR